VRRAPLVLAALAVSAGIALGLARPVPPWGGPFLLPAGLAALGAALALAARSGPGRRNGRWLLAVLAWVGFLLGVATRTEADRSCVRWLPTEQPVTLTAMVTSAAGDRLNLRLESVATARGPVPCAAEVPARRRGGSGDQETTVTPVRIGDHLVVTARWWSPVGAEPGILRRPGALLLDSVSVARAGRGPGVGERVRQGARARTEGLFGAQAGLAGSLLLAQRDGLDPAVRERFARAGLSHLLAISGLHVGLVCGMLLLLGSVFRLGRRWGAVVAAAGTLGYVVLLGAPHSALRAALQLSLVLAASMLQRPTRPEAMIAAAALVLLARDPAALLSPGFQLSFAGVAGLLALRPPLLGLLGGDASARRLARSRRWLADALATSIAATLATAPIVAWHFGQVAPVGIVANLVAIPLLSLALPALALSLLVGTAVPAAGAFLAGPAVLGLELLDRVASLAAAAPGAAVPMHGSTALLLTVALGAGYIVSRRMGRVRPPIRVAAWGGVTVLVLVTAPLRPPGSSVEIHVIDVGQGDAIAVRTPANRWVLVDAGVAGRTFDAGERRVIPYLSRRGVKRLEGLVLTHPHADHTGGATAVIRGLRPRWVGDPGSPAPSAHYLALLRVARDRRMHWVGLRRGATFVLDGVAVEFLHPERIGIMEEDPNDLSIVMRVRYGEFAALLTGDATARVEERLLQGDTDALHAQVLKLGHHGSVTSTTPPFLAATRPRLALVSAGRGNRYGHPHRAVIERVEAAGAQVLRTDRHGAIVVRGDAWGAFKVAVERGTPP
jgi:competence protein ComEC